MRTAFRRCLAAIVVVGGVACSSGSSRGSPARIEPAPRAPTASTVPISPELRAALGRIHALNALGDSVPYGTACDCTPYPLVSGADVARVAHHEVDVFNDAKPGATSADVVEQLQHDQNVIAHLSGSNAVLVEVAANDVAYSAACGTTVECYASKLPEIAHNLTTIVQRVHELAHGRDVPVVLLDYWSVWLGGQYAEGKGPTYVSAANSVTADVNATIRSVAQTTQSIYVDLRTAFRGPDDAWDETHLLASDGEHPNAQGHQRIAHAIAHVVVTRG